MNLLRLQQWLEQWRESTRLSNSRGTFTLKTLAGDGSTRTFYRVSDQEDPAKSSYILLSDPAWDLSKDYAAHQEFLLKSKLPVPRFYQVDPKAGLLLMEDLGDELLQFRIQEEPTEKMAWLEKATVLLAQLHGRTYPVPSSLPVAQRSFDRQKYADELGFTLEHLHQQFLGLPKPAKGRDALLRFCEKIAGYTPLVFCHRDYHCRNILRTKPGLYLIDFQDARMGSPHYDLASLIYDAYVPISPSERARLITCYREELKAYPLSALIRWNNFEQELRQVALQRVLKAAGSFASFYTRYGKTTHLDYLKPALNSAKTLLEEGGAPDELKAIFPVGEWQKRCAKKVAEVVK